MVGRAGVTAPMLLTFWLSDLQYFLGIGELDDKFPPFAEIRIEYYNKSMR
jgi:hypothetical protein